MVVCLRCTPRLLRSRRNAIFALYVCTCLVVAWRHLDTRPHPLTMAQVLVYYRLPVLGCVLAWLWALSIGICAQWGISVRALFELRGNDGVNARSVLQMAATVTLFVSSAISLRVRGGAAAATAGAAGALQSTWWWPLLHTIVHPFTVHAAVLGWLLCPAKWGYAEERWALGRALARTLMAPFRRVQFCDVIIADALTSMSRGLTALEALWCLSSAGPRGGQGVLHCYSELTAALMCLPYWWRFLQCARKFRDTGDAMPHLANALKYSTAFPPIAVDRFGGVLVRSQMLTAEGRHQLWLCCALLNTCYCCFWDVAMDWGLAPELGLVVVLGVGCGVPAGLWSGLGPAAGAVCGVLLGGLVLLLAAEVVARKRGGSSLTVSLVGAGVGEPQGQVAALTLRRVRQYPARCYGLALCLNTSLRLTWMLRLMPLPSWFPAPAITALLLELGELLRRWVWIFFRLEWEAQCKKGGPSVARGVLYEWG
jgi:hypothetical protein